MRSIVRVGSKGKRSEADEALATGQASELDSRVGLIQALIPLGLEVVNELLQREVTALFGLRYQRRGGVPGHARWGSQAGSAHLAGKNRVKERLQRKQGQSCSVENVGRDARESSRCG